MELPEISKDDIRRELHRMVDHAKNELVQAVEEAKQNAREHPEARKPGEQAKIDHMAKELDAKVAEADQIYDQFHRFIDAA